MSESTKEDADKSEQSLVGKAPLRVRSRFPKAQPNLAISSGIARIRRLSGHYSSPTSSSISSHLGLATSASANQDEVYSTLNECKTPPPRSITPSNATVQQTPLSRQLQLIDQVLSPKVTNLNETHVSSPHSPSIHFIKEREVPGGLNSHHHQINSPLKQVNDENYKNAKLNKSNQDGLTISSNVITLPSTPPQSSSKQLIHTPNTNTINNKINSPYATSISSITSHFYHQPQTPTMFHNTPCGSVYNPQFSKEHIMNIIKHKALQKLKKIESETLKERRKKYKRDLNLAANKVDIFPPNQDSNESSSSDLQKDSSTNSSSIDRSKLRMRDLLYYSSRSGMSKKANSNEQNELIVETPPSNDEIILETIEPAKEPPTPPIPKPRTTTVAAPQLKFAEDGSIILNEESLVIQRVHHEPVYESTIVESEQNDNLTYNSYRKFHHTKKWTERETAKFYKALSMIGTDFTMIQRLFTNRNRDEIKRKFKREEKLNQALIDKILSKTSEIDLSIFVSDSSDNEEKKKTGLNKNKNKADNHTSNKLETENNVVANEKTTRKNKVDSNQSGSRVEIIASDSGCSNLKNNQKKKLKRIEKRAFIGSESDSENKTIEEKSNKITDSPNYVSIDEPAKKKYKSKKIIIDDDEEDKSENETQVGTNASSETLNLLPVYQIEISDKIGDITNSSLTSYTSQNCETNTKLPPVSSIFSDSSILISSPIIKNRENYLSNQNFGDSSSKSDKGSVRAIGSKEVICEKKCRNESSISSGSSDSTKSTNSNSLSEEEDDGEGIELVFDMDNNSIKEIKNANDIPNVKNEEQIDLIQDTENRLNDVSKKEGNNKLDGQFLANGDKGKQSICEEEDENVIFDLDNNKVIKNENIIDMNISFNTPTHSKSKITITKIVKE